MQIKPHVWGMHIDDGATAHPGGSNNFFVGDPAEEMVLVDTGDHEREWTRNILDFHKELGSPKIGAIVITHGHGDHTGGLDRLYEAFRAPVRCHPKLAERLGKIVGEDAVVKRHCPKSSPHFPRPPRSARAPRPAVRHAGR